MLFTDFDVRKGKGKNKTKSFHKKFGIPSLKLTSRYLKGYSLSLTKFRIMNSNKPA